MAKMTEEDLFETSYSSRGDEEVEVPTLEELQANMKAARQQSMAAIPVEPLTLQPNKAVIRALEEKVDDVDEVLNEMNREDEEAVQLSEVEVRLEKANCYRVLLQDSMFEDYTPATAEVESEIRTFIQKRLRILMGIEQESTPAGTFSKEEVSALKHLASRVISKNPQMAQAIAPPPPKEEKPQPKLRVRKTAQNTPPQPKRPEAALSAVPDKVKPVRKKKEVVEVTLPNGMTVPTEVSNQTGAKRRTLEELQEIADQASAAAQRDVHRAQNNSLIEKMIHGK